jgi:hypothetical protein
MTRTATSPARGEAAGLGKSSCLGADDSRVSTILPYRNQAVDRARLDTSSPSFTRFGLHRLLIASERLKRARTFASLSKSTPRCLPNLSATSAAIGPCHTLDGGAG